MQKYDAVVIGAGNGGLAAACRMAKGGKKTLLVERHNLPGGCASSAKAPCGWNPPVSWCCRATSCSTSPKGEQGHSMEQFTGSGAVAQQHAFDTDALARWLSASLPGFAGPLTVEQFKGGQSNPTFKLITPGRQYVMRSKPGPLAKLLPSAHAIEREFRVMDALALSGVPVARMHVLCDDESVIGRAFYVMDFVDGRVFWEQSLPDLQHGGIIDVVESSQLGRRHAVLTGNPVQGITRLDLIFPWSRLPRRRHR